METSPPRCDLQLGDIADVARAYPAVVFHLKNTDARVALQSVRSVEGGDAFAGAMQAFLAKYGMRGGSEIDIARARWNDDPTPLIQMLVGNLSRDEPGTHRAHHARLKKQGLEAAERMIQASSYLKRPLVRRLVRVCRQNLAIREHPKFLLIQWFGLMKRVTTECAEMLVREGRLGAKEDGVLPDDGRAERRNAREGSGVRLGTSPPSRGSVSRRKEEHQRNRKLSPPRVMTSEGEIVTKRHAGENLPLNAIAGSAASPGVAKGRPRSCSTRRRPSSKQGKSWWRVHGSRLDAALTNAKGLVMEVGGLMTHGSVVAREYGIPAVVAARTQRRRSKPVSSIG